MNLPLNFQKWVVLNCCVKLKRPVENGVQHNCEWRRNNEKLIVDEHNLSSLGRFISLVQNLPFLIISNFSCAVHFSHYHYCCKVINMIIFSFPWQEFECDLSVEGGVDLGGQERQEFSFTLYDFDGHGKITKDVSLLNIRYICGCDN